MRYLYRDAVFIRGKFPSVRHVGCRPRRDLRCCLQADRVLRRMAMPAERTDGDRLRRWRDRPLEARWNADCARGPEQEGQPDQGGARRVCSAPLTPPGAVSRQCSSRSRNGQAGAVPVGTRRIGAATERRFGFDAFLYAAIGPARASRPAQTQPGRIAARSVSFRAGAAAPRTAALRGAQVVAGFVVPLTDSMSLSSASICGSSGCSG